MNLLEAKAFLAAIAKKLARQHHRFLEKAKKKQTDLKRPDFLWHYMLQSFSTLGSSRGYKGLMEHPERLALVSYHSLLRVAPRKRKRRIEQVFKDAKLRRPRQKAKWLLNNLKKIEDMGGLRKAKKDLLDAPGKSGKISFLKKFDGIGEKYARNLMMDVYHKDFRDCIAVDARIESLSKALELRELKGFKAKEDFYKGVADRAGLSPWALDRLLYGFQNCFLCRIPK